MRVKARGFGIDAEDFAGSVWVDFSFELVGGGDVAPVEIQSRRRVGVGFAGGLIGKRVVVAVKIGHGSQKNNRLLGR